MLKNTIVIFSYMSHAEEYYWTILTKSDFYHTTDLWGKKDLRAFYLKVLLLASRAHEMKMVIEGAKLYRQYRGQYCIHYCELQSQQNFLGDVCAKLHNSYLGLQARIQKILLGRVLLKEMWTFLFQPTSPGAVKELIWYVHIAHIHEGL